MIVIKGMKMPSGADELRLIIRSNGQVVISKKTYYVEAEAIELPPHGRLIDADALEDFIRKDWDKNDHWIADVVYSRPTVIEADSEEIKT